VGAVGGVATTPSRGYYWYRYNGTGAQFISVGFSLLGPIEIR
jgi:hypothetical protein